jgi:hypothetical protein
MTNGAQPQLLDTGAAPATWRPTAPRALPGRPARQHANAVLLADGKVLVCGGCSNPNDDATGVRAAEIFDPWTDTWAVGDTAAVVRNYHSVALLMPDGRVFTAGGNSGGRQSFPSPGVDTRELRIEIYSPPYVTAPRPAIGWAPGSVRWSESFWVHTSQADRIRRVALVRAGSATHAWNGDQRYVGCTFVRAGDHLARQGTTRHGGRAPGAVPARHRERRWSPIAGALRPRRTVPSRQLLPPAERVRQSGNLEFLAPRPGGGLRFWWRDNDNPSFPWGGPHDIPTGGGVAEVPSMLQGNFGGNLEVVTRIGDRLAFYWRAGSWNGPAQFGAPGDPREPLRWSRPVRQQGQLRAGRPARGGRARALLAQQRPARAALERSDGVRAVGGSS